MIKPYITPSWLYQVERLQGCSKTLTDQGALGELHQYQSKVKRTHTARKQVNSITHNSKKKEKS